jgi:hypothetical protein
MRCATSRWLPFVYAAASAIPSERGPHDPVLGTCRALRPFSLQPGAASPILNGVPSLAFGNRAHDWPATVLERMVLNKMAVPNITQKKLVIT